MTAADTAETPTVAHIRLDLDGPVATIVIDRPEKRNALTLEMWEELEAAVRGAETDAAVRVVVVRGAGDRAFAAGADIAEFRERRTRPDDARRYNETSARAERALAECRVPTIAAIRGACVGGGCELAVACDLRIADTTAYFALTPARLGLVYAPAATRRLVDVAGVATAKRMLLTAARLDAEEALRTGLVTQVVAPDQLDAAVEELATRISALSRTSLSGIKSVIGMVCAGDAADWQRAADITGASFASADYVEGVAAFLERRDPEFS